MKYPNWLPSLKALRAALTLILNILPAVIVSGLICDRLDVILRLTIYQEQRILPTYQPYRKNPANFPRGKSRSASNLWSK